MVFLAVNIGLSLPSKAAHQLPWLPSVCVRVKERKGERGKKKNTMYQRSRNAFMPDFGLGWVLLSIIFPSWFSPSSKDGGCCPNPWTRSPNPPWSKIHYCGKMKSFVRKWKQTHLFLFFFLWEYSVACRLLGQSSAQWWQYVKQYLNKQQEGSQLIHCG